MATVHLTGTTLTVAFTRSEKLLGLVRDLTVPLTAVDEAHVEPDGLHAARGLRAPGMSLPWQRKIGTWRRRGTRSLVSVRRSQPALSVRLHGERYDLLLVGVDDAARYADLLATSR